MDKKRIKKLRIMTSDSYVQSMLDECLDAIEQLQAELAEKVAELDNARAAFVALKEDGQVVIDGLAEENKKLKKQIELFPETWYTQKGLDAHCELRDNNIKLLQIKLEAANKEIEELKKDFKDGCWEMRRGISLEAAQKRIKDLERALKGMLRSYNLYWKGTNGFPDKEITLTEIGMSVVAAKQAFKEKE